MKSNNDIDIDIERSQKEFWNKRFGESEYIYGKEPNAFFKSVIDGLPPGKIFIPGGGEGRDAVYAATKGWQVTCVDMSEEGRKKALRLAIEKDCVINYEIRNINDVDFPDSSFDLIASIFFHLPTGTRTRFYQNAVRWLKPGGLFILEGFTPQQLQFASGGPKDVELLVSAEQLLSELKGLDLLKITESDKILNEGTYHKGRASIVNYAGKKKS